MATYIKGQSISLAAAENLTAKQFYAAKIDSTGKAALAAAGEATVGIIQNNPAAGQPASVMISGTSKAVAGGSISAGNLVAANADGKIVAATLGRTNTSDTGAAADALLGSNVIGIALADAASGDIFPIVIMHMGASPTTVS